MSTGLEASLPVVNQALEPAWVRSGSTQVKQDYESALAFEGVLVEQLTSTLSSSEALGEEESEQGEGGLPHLSSGFSQMLPQALANGVASGGGLGLAAQLTQELAGHEGVSMSATTTAQAGATGGASA